MTQSMQQLETLTTQISLDFDTAFKAIAANPDWPKVQAVINDDAAVEQTMVVPLAISQRIFANARYYRNYQATLLQTHDKKGQVANRSVRQNMEQAHTNMDNAVELVVVSRGILTRNKPGLISKTGTMVPCNEHFTANFAERMSRLAEYCLKGC
jgi:hypothetical protein